MQRLPIILRLGFGLIISISASLAIAQPSPDITVHQAEARTIKEYRINGELYAIEVIPRQGTRYFLVDDDGDGNFERNETSHVEVPDWVSGGE
ncbi:uncharacterized protein DUF2782 [Chromohalobacter marismortui]|uniref:Uncharacterized protein DUF2782 n=1 Tax=Chromohalobacter marismortui TaxID=42055 RepID=A0A4R7NTX6_9GAMM|nr:MULTISPECIES: DUF2782 domain-containing protein [Chromohalobacter]MCI0509029.1 DUF2782 domain-containing protein [Chromohalobacter sp.]MCI0592866.1 DUF2782 domain-containing protein [Chromohalobacter sp.]TDU24081.1 uncharacterized protein DUF2782 [Chromohalobacter marismortui]